MTTSTLFHRATLLGALMMTFQTGAQAAAMPPQMLDMYKQMCVKAATMPKPHGEWDLKGNAKLGAYCDCFSPLFAARAMKASEFMQKNPGKAPGTLEESNKEELAMRNTCRKQVGLPGATP